MSTLPERNISGLEEAGTLMLNSQSAYTAQNWLLFGIGQALQELADEVKRWNDREESKQELT